MILSHRVVAVDYKPIRGQCPRVQCPRSLRQDQHSALAAHERALTRLPQGTKKSLPEPGKKVISNFVTVSGKNVYLDKTHDTRKKTSYRNEKV